jgi:excisionase family DNA binding protein
MSTPDQLDASPAMNLDVVFRGILREVVREVLREELSVALARLAPPPEQEPARYLPAKSAAEVSGVAEKTIRAWVRQGRLRGHWAGRLLRIERGELDRFLATSGAQKKELDVDAIARNILHRR